MRQLILMRHGKAVAASATGDHTRALSPRGRAEALEAGRRIAELARPEAMLVSDSTRTLETLDSAAPALPQDLARRVTRNLYGASADAILAEIRATPDEVATLLVIGHNPGIGDLARRLARDGEDGAIARLAEGFPTSCFAVIETDVDTWSALDAAGRLAFLLPADERSGG